MIVVEVVGVNERPDEVSFTWRGHCHAVRRIVSSCDVVNRIHRMCLLLLLLLPVWI